MLIVKKFGGSSVTTPQRIYNIIDIVKKCIENGDKIVIVVSAQSGMTDNILSNIEIFKQNQLYKENKLLDDDLKRIYKETDQALICGESMNASIISAAFNINGIKSISFNAYNLPIIGSGDFFDADISEINTKKIIKYLDLGFVPIITGFQSININSEYCMSLGRGGSDYTAVILAAALNADECFIYSDVDGIFTSDPNIIKNSKKIEKLTYDEAIIMAASGAKILQEKSAICAKKYNINLRVLSSFVNSSEITNKSGTMLFSNSLIQRDQNKFYFAILSKDKNKGLSNLINFNSMREISIVFIGSKNKVKEILEKINFQEKILNFLNIQNASIIYNNFVYEQDKNKTSFCIELNYDDLKIYLNKLNNFCQEIFTYETSE
jgi:aspartate kinase